MAIRQVKWIVVLVLALGIASCQSGPERRKPVTYRTSARENFIKGKKAFDDEDYLEAIEFFKFVKNKFPYSKYSIEADLYLADCYFKRDKYLEAAEAYENFVKLHPRHPRVPYAMFQVAACHFEKIPSDWFLIPPAYEMDQAETVITINKLRKYLRNWGQHEKAKEARRMLAECLKRMAQRSMYVLDFYRSRRRYQAVVWRADEILSKYSGVGFDEEALMRKAQALVELEQPGEATKAISQLLSRFPQGRYADDARQLLQQVQRQVQRQAQAKQSTGKKTAGGKPVDGKPGQKPENSKSGEHKK
ncbi:MAG: hypothetical protein DRI34_13800 [Deltaproteobacteria bacterium]|nr:MAG: hypothetical protein DRI34_13800 [Deltaproteobacteria bacterium]